MQEKNPQNREGEYRRVQSPPVTHSDLILFFILIVSIIRLALQLKEE